MQIQSVGIVGYGAFGTLVHTLVQKFAPQITVRVHSSRHEPDGKIFFSLEETAASDALVLAVPIHAFEETLGKVLPLMRENTVVVDVATVKIHTVEILKRLAGNRQYVATHPMFGPESYQKRKEDVRGFRIVISDSTIPEDIKRNLIQFLEQRGFDVVEMPAEQHDKHLAETLFLTHFIGQIVSHGKFNRTEIDTVSFGYLMDAVESVRHDEQLFKDVFRFNPHCKEVLEHFALSEKETLEKLK